MPPAPDPFVRVVVLNWNSAWYTRRCLRSLARTDYPADRMEVVLVDNGSVDGSLEQLRYSFPDLRTIANGANLGFAEGCNRGMRDRSGVDHVALVNNDAVVEPGWLRALVDALEADPAAGAASARLVLEPAFAPVDVVADGVVSLEQAVLDGLDVTGAVRTDGFRTVPALDWPLDLTRELPGPGRGRLWIPAGPASRRLELRWGGPGRAEVEADGSEVRPTGPRAVEVDLGPLRRPLLNGVGTALNELCEGYDLHYGEVDDGRVAPGVVPGFCGGGALLRGRMLDEVGLLDPELFAYYEDTDLSWRARRAGWHVLGVPSAEIHHAFGGSAGSRAPGFLYLDRRNWWLTADRNGSAAQRAAVRRTVRRSVLKAVRANVVGRARRRRAPRWALVGTWLRIAADRALLARRRRRATGTIGAVPTDRVRGRFQPRPGPRAPRPRPGGPELVYVDVTDTLRSGWRAGIQQVVRRVVAELPDAAPDVELVPIVRTTDPAGFRRVDAAEYALLLGPATGGRRAPARGPGRARRAAVAAVDGVGLGPAARRARRSLPRAGDGGAEVLRLERLEPGATLLELDAVWNQASVHRGPLLADLRASGVRIVPFVHDLAPVEHPEWFVPELVDAFERTVTAQLDHADLVVTNSAATAEGVLRLAARRGRPDLPVRPVPLGVDPPPPEPARLPVELVGLDYLLVVGTVEPRKGQSLALDAFDLLADDDPDLHLVVVGRAGWRADDVVARLRRATTSGRVHWFDSAGDDQVDALQRGAFAVLVPSVTEGYGLPLAEAIGRGAPVLSSPGGALAETAGGVAELLDPSDPQAWAAAVRRLRSDPAARGDLARRSRDAVVPTWADTAREIGAVLAGAGRAAAPRSAMTQPATTQSGEVTPDRVSGGGAPV